MATTTGEGKKGIGKAGFAEVSTMDELKQLGWRVEKLGSGWSAYEIHGDRKIGPATSIRALRTQVDIASGPAKANGKAAAESDSESFAGDAETPSTRLPGMEEPAIEALDRQADMCLEALKKRKDATAASKDQDDIMREKMREHGRKRYSRRGFSIVIEDSDQLVIKKAEQAPPRNPKIVKKADISKE
ncbi:hypothetical protein BH10ACI2_BH10ACI2_00120 [soil metagenome]